MATDSFNDQVRVVLLIEGPAGRQAYRIGEGPNIPFTVSQDENGRIEVSGLFLGGMVWDGPMPDIKPDEITSQENTNGN